MGDIKIPYYVRKAWKGRLFGYWQPTKVMRAYGFQAIRCGEDGPEAWGVAAAMNVKWQNARRGLGDGSEAKVYPKGSLGEALHKYKQTQTWALKAARTREDWERCWAKIEPAFGDVAPSTVDLATIDLFYADPKIGLLATVGVREAHRVIKIWRALWRVSAALGYCERDADPSLAIRRTTPKPRSAVWREGEIVRLVKGAIRVGHGGLAAIIAVAWDTQLSPGDVRKLTPAHMSREGTRTLFRVDRSKTGAAALGTLSRRAERVVGDYLKTLAAQPLPNAHLFRNRSGRPYSKDTLGDDFRAVRGQVLPGDDRKLLDMRRSGAVEASAGGVNMNDLAAKMANTINQSSELQRTYQPTDLTAVRNADAARRRGRGAIRENG